MEPIHYHRLIVPRHHDRLNAPQAHVDMWITLWITTKNIHYDYANGIANLCPWHCQRMQYRYRCSALYTMKWHTTKCIALGV